MRPGIKKALLVLALSTLVCCVSLGITSLFYDPFDPPQDSLVDLYPRVYYKINPVSILTDIENGNVENAFRLIDVEPSFTDIYPSGSFLWKQEDYMEIANAHLFYRTGETMEDGWFVYGVGKFRIDACSDDMRGFDSAEIRLFKRASDGGYDGFVVDIRPLEETLMSGEGWYKAVLFDDRYAPSKVIESNLTAEDALQIAEQVIGKEMRQKLTNDGCRVSVSYFRDEYWNVSYRWFKDDLDFSLWVEVNVNDRQYKIKSHVYKCERTICP